MLRDVLLAVIPGLVIAGVTALLTVRLSVSQFHSQRWWETQAEKYSAVLEHLATLEYAYSRFYERETEGLRFTEDYEKKLSVLSTEASLELKRAANIGAFYVSKQAADSLAAVRKALDSLSDSFAHIDAVLVAARQAIKEVREEAKRELGVR